MSEPVRILGSDVPTCAADGCKMHALDGYCYAGCCIAGPGGKPKAYCAQHSHRPRMVLEILGHSVAQESYTPAEVLNIISAMWRGAGDIYQAQGYLDMMRDVARERMAEAQRQAAPPTIPQGSG